ncbi:accessory gene regulator B [Bacilli bacterium PM5-3]|nr:accessory gene regulator B [Bacilli bacterium PM5-3]
MYNKLQELMIKNKIINEEEAEVFIYGIELFFLKLAHTLIVLLIGLMFNRFLETFFFVIFYEMLKTNINSYHSKSKIICYLLSVLMAIGLIILLRYSNYFTINYLFDFLIILFSAFYFILTRKSNRSKNAILVLIVMILLYYFFRYQNYTSFILVILYGISLSVGLSFIDYLIKR